MFPYCALDWGLPWILRQYAILVLVGIKPLPATPQSTGLYLPVFKLNWSQWLDSNQRSHAPKARIIGLAIRH